MASLETKSRLIVRRLKREGWTDAGSGRGPHHKFEHPDRPGVLIVVPRHPEVSKKVASNIAKDAGWK